MKIDILRIPAIAILLVTSIFSFGQKNHDDVKKAHLLPVYLHYIRNPADSTFDKMVQEAFTRHKVKLIGKREFDQLNENEASRLVTKYRSVSSQFSSERELRDAVAKDQRFVSNELVTIFKIESSGDTVSVSGVTWKNTPSPGNVNSSRTSGEIVTELKIPCSSLREQVFALVDEIIFSKWLR